jgi:hypothetical protein
LYLQEDAMSEPSASSTESTGKTFQLGLALSGAISAGAYTAGVLDFLFQALQEWEQQRGHAGVPDHHVVLKVVTGASAGAITGALGAIALARGMNPKHFTPAELNNAERTPGKTYQTLRCVLPSLYDTWVTYPSLVAPQGKISFLTAEDLQTPPPLVQSLLNARLLDWIKQQALLCPTDAAPDFKPNYAYVADPLHVYLTFSNLRGMPFTVPFGNSSYGMQTHGDRVHYIVTDLGGRKLQDSDWVAHDKGIPLSVTTLPPYGETATALEAGHYPAWNTYGECALASAAFPIGLAPRQLAFPVDQYFGRNYPLKVSQSFINPSFPPTFLADKNVKFGFLNVDGGLINNNPFDYAQYALMGGASAPKTQGREADKAVIMVSPFPESPAFLPEGQPAAELVAVVRALYPTLINQVRFKVEELAPAADENDLSRFLIAPERNIDGVDQRFTIACGLLGGFGGFLDQRFRAHDFQLGRRNCQRFLTATFNLPASNDIAAGMKALGPRFESVRDNGKPETYTIIPLLGSAVAEVPLPHWPRMSTGDFDSLLTQIATRLKAVGPVLVRAQTTNRVLRTLALIGLAWSGDQIRQYIKRSILSDLVRRDQIEGWELPALTLPPDWTQDDVRAVLGELINPAFDLRSAASIAERTHTTERSVADVLDQLRKAESGKPFQVTTAGDRDGKTLYALPSQLSTISRWRAKLRGWPVVGSVERALEPLGID